MKLLVKAKKSKYGFGKHKETVIVRSKTGKIYSRNQTVGREKKHDKVKNLYSRYNAILKKVNSDITPKMDKKSRTALGVKLIMLLGLRIGNKGSAEGFERKASGEVEQTFGLSTLLKDHVVFQDGYVYLNFPGKKSVDHNIKITNKVLVDQISNAYNKTKNEKFLDVSKYHVAEYIRQNIGKEYTPKDLRGLKANIEATRKSEAIKKKPKPKTKTAALAELKEIAEHVSSKLGNTVGVAKRSYIDPLILDQHIRSRFKVKK